MLGGDLSKAILPAIVGPNQLVIQFSSEYNQQYSNCASANHLSRVQEAVRQLTGELWLVRVERLAGTERAVADKGTASPADDKLSVDPLVYAVQSSFDARLLKMDEGFGKPATTPDNDEPDLTPNETEEE